MTDKSVPVRARVGDAGEYELGTVALPEDASPTDINRKLAGFFRDVAHELTAGEAGVDEVAVPDPDEPGRVLAEGYISAARLGFVRFWCDRSLEAEQAVEVGEALAALGRTAIAKKEANTDG